jgi:predicted ATPase
LGAAKEIAQIGATIGREFAFILVKAISKLKDDLLIERLEKLVRAEMLLEDGELPNMMYTFKHALIQEAAYSSLLKKRRQEFHQRIVDTLETDFPELMKTNPELMAHHCSEGGLLEKAIPYWRRAGELAVSKSAHQEAIIHLNEGLHILHQLPVTDERIEDEILFLIALGVPLTALRGYGSEEVEKAYSRARTLCSKLGNTMQLIPTLYGLWRYYLLTAQYSEARYLSNEILKLSQESSEPLHQAIGNRAAGSTHFYLGELDDARSRLGAIIALETNPETRANTLVFDVVDSWVTARSYESWTLWLGGHTEAAFKQIEAAMEMANQLNHPFSMALSVSFATWLYQFQGDKEKTLQYAQDGLKIAKQNGFSFWVGWAEILEAWALDTDPADEQYLDSMLAGLAHWESQGSRLGSSYFLYLIAEGFYKHGKISDAWTTLEQAKNFIHRTKEGFWEAEIYRMEGRLQEASGPQNLKNAEVCYRKALKKASQQNAKSLELRAANSLARLLAETPRRNEGYLILQEKIKWFDDDLETPDLLEAKLTLENLSVIQN